MRTSRCKIAAGRFHILIQFQIAFPDPAQTAADNADAVIADRNFKKVLPGFEGVFIDFPHFAVSGRLLEE